MMVLLIGMTSAYYPGESITIPNDIGISNLVYTIVGNSSPVSPLSVVINNSNITIIFPGDMTPDNFSIIFLENKTYEVVKTVHTSSRSTRTKYVDKNITVYVPEYTNITEIVEVEKVIEVGAIDNSEIIIEKEYKLWEILLVTLLGIIVAIIFCSVIFRKKKRKEDNENYAQELIDLENE